MRSGPGNGKALDSTQHLAAAIVARMPHGNLHVGVLYRTGDGHVEAIHLGWEDNLQTGWEWVGFWATPDAEPEKLRSVAATCRRVLARFKLDPRFPYGVMYGAEGFDDDGTLIVVPPARGLTCATFVIAIFQTAGVLLVAPETWPVRPELNDQFLELVRPFCGAYAGLYEKLEAEVAAGCIRYLPEEVVGACTLEIPADYAAALNAGQAIVREFASMNPSTTS